MFKCSAEQIFTEIDFDEILPTVWPKSAILNEIEIVSEDLHHLRVGASPAINGLIVFTWLQDNADDAREAPNFATSSSLSDATNQKFTFLYLSKV